MNPDEVYSKILKDLMEQGLSQKKFKLTGMLGGASNRGYLRLVFDSSSESSIGSLIIMLHKAPDLKQGIEEIVEQGFEIKELPFINVLRHFRSAGVAVPELYYVNTNAGLLYLEDLGDTLLREIVSKDDEEKKRFWLEQALDELIRIQLKAGSLKNPEFIGFRVRFNRYLLDWELEHFQEWALEKRSGIKFSEKDRALLKQAFKKITEQLLSAPYILNHRDYHIDNLMVHNQKLWVLDFQDALLAPYVYDLACFLYDRDTALILGDNLIEEMIKLYFEKLKESGYQPLKFDQYRRIFDLCVLHRAFKVVGRFYFLAHSKNKPEYLNFLPAEYLVLKKYLERFKEFRPVRLRLANYLQELA